MSLPRTLAVAWREWRRMKVPSEQYRVGNKKSLAYDLEGDLEHLASSVYTLGNALMEHEDWDFAMRAIDELGQVEKARAELEQGLASLNNRDAKRYTEYLNATERLLREMAKR